MTLHPPKHLALEALLDDQLSDQGRARLSRHLEACATCRRELSLMRQFRDTAQQVQAEPPPSIDWDRIEAAVEREAPLGPADAAVRRRWMWPALAVAAALLLMWLQPSDRPAEEQASRVPAPVEATPEAPGSQPPAQVTPQITLAANQITQDPGGGQRPLSVDDALVEGTTLESGPHGAVHVRLSPGTGFALERDSAVELEQMRRGRVRLVVERGRVVSHVAKLAAGDSFVVVAGPYEAHVRGTRFAVRHLEGRQEVEVAEGRVEVLRAGTVVASVGPSEHWHSGDAGAGARSAGEDAGEADALLNENALRGLASAEPDWVPVQLPASERVRAWLLPTSGRLEAPGALAVRYPAGPAELKVEDRNGRVHTLDLQVGADGLVLTEQDIRTRMTPTVRWGTLRSEQIRPVVQAGLSGLRRCYERALRTDSATSGSVRLKITVGVRGKVSRVDVEGTPDVTFQRCVRMRAQRWEFPEPEGGQVKLELPLNLKPRRQ